MIKRTLAAVIGLWFLISLIGCEAFVRKFTRKSEKKQEVEMVVTPEEYIPPAMSKEDQYRQYFLYWKSWQDELIESLSSGTNQKKRIGCADEAIKNLQQLRPLFNQQAQARLDGYLSQLQELRNAIVADAYGNMASTNRVNAERIRRNILKEFSYRKIKDSLT